MGGNVLTGSEIQAVHGRVNRNHHFAQDIRKGPLKHQQRNCFPSSAQRRHRAIRGSQCPKKRADQEIRVVQSSPETLPFSHVQSKGPNAPRGDM